MTNHQSNVISTSLVPKRSEGASEEKSSCIVTKDFSVALLPRNDKFAEGLSDNCAGDWELLGDPLRLFGIRHIGYLTAQTSHCILKSEKVR
jgi:hypothetical protein